MCLIWPREGRWLTPPQGCVGWGGSAKSGRAETWNLKSQHRCSVDLSTPTGPDGTAPQKHAERCFSGSPTRNLRHVRLPGKGSRDHHSIRRHTRWTVTPFNVSHWVFFFFFRFITKIHGTECEFQYIGQLQRQVYTVSSFLWGAGSSIPQRQNHMIRRDHLALPVFSCLRQMTK